MTQEESIYRINTNGTVDVVHIAPEQELGQFYVQALQCTNFTYVKEHRIVSNGRQTDYTLFLVCTEDPDWEDFNSTVSQILGDDICGPALLVCMHAVGADGQERLADVGLIYNALGSNLPTHWTEHEIAEIRSAPLKDRVLELLGLFDLEL